MKKFIRTFITALTILCMAVPTAEAQRHQGARNDRPGRETPSRGHGGGHGSRPSSQGSRPGASRPSSNSRPASNSRPSNGGNHGNTGGRPGSSRPGNNGNHGNHGNNPGRPGSSRPGNNGNHGNGNHGNNPGRPGNNGNHGNTGGRPGSSRPGNNGNHGNHGNHSRPGNNHRPDHGGRPGFGNHRPGPRPPMMRPPHRPYRPHMVRPHYRPVPPPAWRPARRVPYVRTILGISFGTAFNVSLDYLYNNGYTVDGYGNNIVYLRNVPMLNMVWTDGALYYGNSGFDLSSFYYSTPVYDMTRYNSSYNMLVNSYGSPYEVTNVGGTITSTWFAGGNSFITLSFGASNGRYLTTLSVGM